MGGGMATLSVLPLPVDKSLIRKGSATGPDGANNNPGEPGRPLCRPRMARATKKGDLKAALAHQASGDASYFFFGAIIMTI